MERAGILVAFCGLVCSSLPSTAQDADVYVHLSLDPAATDSVDLNPIVELQKDGHKATELTGDAQGGGLWLFHVPLGNQLAVLADVSVDGAVPTGYPRETRRICVARNKRGGRVDVYLVPTLVADTARKTRELNEGVDVKAIGSSESAQRYYHISRANALQRTATTSMSRTGGPHVYTIQAQFIYLDILNKMCTVDKSLLPPEDLTMTLQWCENAMHKWPPRVAIALGDSCSDPQKPECNRRAKDIMNSGKSMEGTAFSELYSIIKNTEDPAERYGFLKDYDNLIQKMPDDSAKRIKESTGVFRFTILADMAYCLSKSEGKGNVKNMLEEVRYVQNQCEAELSTTHPEESNSKLKKCIDDLSTLAGRCQAAQ
jgi:hypothetical protein